MKGSEGKFQGDLAESFEFSPDRLTVTFKLRPNAGFAPVAPVNGRLMDAQDILYSWERFSKLGAARTDFVNSLNPSAPITSLTSPDPKTIVMKLAQPDATIAAHLSAPQSGRFNIVPREIEKGYDPRGTLIGTGPFYMAEYTPSSRYVFKRNPGFYDQTKPYFDAIEYNFIPEYATGSSQLKAGNIYSYGSLDNPTLRQEDVLQFKKDAPDLVLSQTDVKADGSGGRFGYKNTDKGVFRDERLRQAFSMAIDRDLWLDVTYNVSALEKDGLTMVTRWSSAALCDDFEGWWLDPKDEKKFGPNAKYFKHDPAEAKKLLAAAGFANGVEVISNSAPNGYDSKYPTQIEIFEGMAKDAGFKFTKNIVDYATTFQPKYRDNHGDFEGIAYGPLLSLTTDSVGKLAGLFLSTAGATFLGMDPDGKGTFAGDPRVDDDIKKARLEVDQDKRRQLMIDLQKYLGAKQYVFRYPGGASGFRLTWPAIKNVGVYHNDVRPWFNEWLDPTQKPLA
jgi:peptide/nickel transport system substrate-binding protein